MPKVKALNPQPERPDDPSLAHVCARCGEPFALDATRRFATCPDCDRTMHLGCMLHPDQGRCGCTTDQEAAA